MAISCKKTVATGARTTVIMMEERCFGFLNTEVLDQEAYKGQPKRIEITSESIINEIATFESASLSPSRAIIRRQQGTASVGGDVSAELANNGFGWLITQAVGKIIGSGTAGDPYTILPVDGSGVDIDKTAGFQQTPGEYVSEEITYDPTCSDLPGYEVGSYEIDANGMEPGFTLYISRDGGTLGGITGAAPTDINWFRYNGMKVNTWAVTASPTEIVTTTFSLLGREEEIVDQPEPTPLNSSPEINDPFSGFNGTITIDGQEECILSIDFSLANNLGADQFCMGDKNRNSLPEGRREITGTFTTELVDLVFYNKYLTGTGAVLVINFDLFDDGTETMKITMPKIQFNGTTPTSEGPDAIVQSLPFTAIFDESPADSLLVLGANTVAPEGFDIAIEIVTAGTLV